MTVIEANCVLEHKRDPERPRRAMPGLYVCAGHRIGLARELLELPDMYERLVERHVAGSTGQSEIRAGGYAGLSLSDKVAVARGNIVSELGTRCRLVAEERGFTPPTAGVRSMARFLIGSGGRMLDWCCAQPWADEFHSEVDHLHREAWRLLHPGRARHITVAACAWPLWTDVATRAEHTCPGALVVTFRGDSIGIDTERYPDAVCDDECGREVPPVQWLRLVDRDLRLTADELALLWSVPLPTVRRWSRDWATDGGRPARYSVAEAQRSLRRYRPDTEGVSA